MDTLRQFTKLENFPQDRRLEVLRSNERLLELKREALRLQEQMHYALVQEWTKMDKIEFNGKRVLSLLDAYHSAVESRQEQFAWDGYDFVTGYAKYLLEYLGTHVPMSVAEKASAISKRARHRRRMDIITGGTKDA